MIEDIKLTGIKQEVIDKLLEELGYDTVLSMAYNYKKLNENINFLKSININVIDELLLNRNQIFFEEPNILKEKLFRYEISNLAKLINDDYQVIDEILK